MPWSAKHIAPQSSLAMKTARAPAGGDFSWGRQDPAGRDVSWGGQAPASTLNDPTLGSRHFGRIDPNLTPISNDSKLASAAPAGPKSAAQTLKERVGGTSGLYDSALGSRSPSKAPAVNPGSLIQASTFKSPYAPQFLTDAVTGLNETQSYTSMMHDEWRNTLLRASEGRDDLSPALAAASTQPGAHFSLGISGGPRSSAPVQRQPSYWEQKLAFEDQSRAAMDLKLGEDMLKQSQQSPGVGGSGNYQNTLALEAQDRIAKAKTASLMSRKVTGSLSDSEMISDRYKELRRQYYGQFSPAQVNISKGNNPWAMNYDVASGYGSGW